MYVQDVKDLAGLKDAIAAAEDLAHGPVTFRVMVTWAGEGDEAFGELFSITDLVFGDRHDELVALGDLPNELLDGWQKAIRENGDDNVAVTLVLAAGNGSVDVDPARTSTEVAEHV
jgi:hypothetical protein